MTVEIATKCDPHEITVLDKQWEKRTEKWVANFDVFKYLADRITLKMLSYYINCILLAI